MRPVPFEYAFPRHNAKSINTTRPIQLGRELMGILLFLVSSASSQLLIKILFGYDIEYFIIFNFHFACYSYILHTGKHFLADLLTQSSR